MIVAGASVGFSEEDCPITQALEFVHVQDISLSYGNDLPVLRNKMPELLQYFAKDFPSSRFSLVTFMDKGWGEGSVPYGFGFQDSRWRDHCYRIEQALTAAPSMFLGALDKLRIGHGGRTPESQLDSIYRVAKQIPEIGWLNDNGLLRRFDDEARSVFRVIALATDASFHEGGEWEGGLLRDGESLPEATPYGECEDQNFPFMEDVRDALQAIDAKLLLLVTDGVYEYYSQRAPEFGVPVVIARLDDNSENIVEAVKDGLLDLIC
eukprot:Polyplicarium_translucidae@DN3594_c0_g1_i1.p1